MYAFVNSFVKSTSHRGFVKLFSFLLCIYKIEILKLSLVLTRCTMYEESNIVLVKIELKYKFESCVKLLIIFWMTLIQHTNYVEPLKTTRIFRSYDVGII